MFPWINAGETYLVVEARRGERPGLSARCGVRHILDTTSRLKILGRGGQLTALVSRMDELKKARTLKKFARFAVRRNPNLDQRHQSAQPNRFTCLVHPVALA